MWWFLNCFGYINDPLFPEIGCFKCLGILMTPKMSAFYETGIIMGHNLSKNGKTIYRWLG